MRKSVCCALVLLGVWATSAAPQSGQSMFVYQNNFWLNLHEFLRGEIYRRGAKLAPGIDPAALNEADRTAWQSALETYTEVAKQDQIFDEAAHRISNALATTGDATRLRAGLLDARTTAALNRAAPIYRSRLWPTRQHDNDTWNKSARTLTDKHQTAMATALAKAYRITWPRQPYLVDAVGETGANSGFTHAPPSDKFAAHIHASVGSVRNTGNAPLELMFHEASHVRAVGGEITRFIQEECKRQSLDVPPELQHFMIMFTSGEVTRRELARSGSPGYVPYIYRYNQLPPAVLAAFERHWLPYLNGETPFAQALAALVRDAR